MLENRQDINYIKLTFAVCGGFLLALLIWTTTGVLLLNAVVDTRATSINEQVGRFTQQMQETTARAKRDAARRQEQQRSATEQQRIKSTTGQTLSRECSEYSQFYRDNPSDYVKQERERICSMYRNYVSTGTRPQS